MPEFPTLNQRELATFLGIDSKRLERATAAGIVARVQINFTSQKSPSRNGWPMNGAKLEALNAAANWNGKRRV